MDLFVPRGFRVAGVHCGIKADSAKQDLTLIVGDETCVAAGVYTQNLIQAAPVVIDRARTPSANLRVVVANSGNANACTGDRGMQDALAMARFAAEACDAAEEQSLVMSTGVIGEFLPMEKIAAGVTMASKALGNDSASLINAARGILTTDRSQKVTSRTVDLSSRQVRIAGMAKGAGMIGPRMATMLAVVMTDAPLSVDDAQTMLQKTADASFNCISVEGHMSTNDTLLLLASGKAGGERLKKHEREAFGRALLDVCVELARMIPDDGEGAAHLITIDVRGCATSFDARQIAHTVANSALVKTAIAGGDPNWGRIVSAAGYAQVPFDPAGVSLHVNGTLLFRQGEPVAFDKRAVSAAIRDHRETHIQLDFSEGDSDLRFWTSDLTVDYVRFNAEYHT